MKVRDGNVCTGKLGFGAAGAEMVKLEESQDEAERVGGAAHDGVCALLRAWTGLPYVMGTIKNGKSKRRTELHVRDGVKGDYYFAGEYLDLSVSERGH